MDVVASVVVGLFAGSCVYGLALVVDVIRPGPASGRLQRGVLVALGVVLALVMISVWLSFQGVSAGHPLTTHDRALGGVLFVSTLIGGVLVAQIRTPRSRARRL